MNTEAENIQSTLQQQREERDLVWQKQREEREAKQEQERKTQEAKEKAKQRKERKKFFSKFEVEPPAHLSEKSKSIWRESVPATIRCLERTTLLQVGLEALDRADQAKAILDRDGMTTMTGRSGVMHAHPCIKIEKDSRAQFISVWQSLDFHKLDIVRPHGI